MWVFYMISLPLTVGMVAATLRYFAGPAVPAHVLAVVGYAWLSSLSFVVLVPTDIWTAISGNGNQKNDVGFFWSWSYWSTFILAWSIVPTLQGYEDSGEFTFRERLKTSIHKNMTYYATVGAIGLFGIILIIIMRHDWVRGILGFSMACSNTFGLVTGAFLLGFGLSEIPRNVVQATSNQMSKRDPLRPCMDMINNMLTQMLQDDPLFKPSGGKLGEHDMDYDSDNKTMATLRRQLRKAHEEYYRRKSDYMTCVVEALELEDTIRNYEQRDASGWKYLSSFRESRSGTLGSFLDSIEFIWRCLLRKQLMRVLAVILGCVSASILLAEATLLPSDVDLSLFSNLINAVGKQEVLVQVAAFVPLMYMCICTYYSLIRIGMMLLYSLTPGQTSSVSLLMICSMVARYAPPISYNFLNLIHLGGNAKTTFEKRMGNIDDVVPFFGRTFNKIYPLIMVVYTLLVAVNFFEHLIVFFGSLKRFKCWTDQEGDMDGLDPSGVFILQKERNSMEQGRKVSEHAAPLARNFSCLGEDVESGNIPQGDGTVETEPERTAAQPKHGGDVAQRYSPAREKCSSPKPVEVQKGISSTSKSNEPPCVSAAADSPAETASRWASMKMGFQNLRATMGGSKKFLLLGLSPRAGTNESATESLDEIFRKLKRHSSNAADANRLDDDDGLPF
ncbi:LMBR1 domain-containing protein 2 A [Zea mays]|uniref:LMBR1 domain-containing protein 2 A n=1 Tax=Zea mays TaxID=4577 RepID=A0A3L6ECX5_MAIZE|nr:LMBR1 domain-containing protein 2 A [Zea mays]